MSKSRPWTPFEVGYLISQSPYRLPGDIAIDLNRTKASVRSFAYHHRILTRNVVRKLISTYKERNGG